MLGRIVYIGVPSDAPSRMDVEGMAATLDRIVVERVLQDLKWGTRRTHADGSGGASAKLLADQARELCDRATELGVLSWAHILEEEVAESFAEATPEKLEAELVQVAAVAVAWLEDLRRRRLGVSPRTKADAPTQPPGPAACQRCGGRAFTGESMGPLGWRKCAGCGMFTATSAPGVAVEKKAAPEAGPVCPACHGEGRLEGANCAHCQGRGEAP